MRLLLSKGADIHAKDEMGRTALHNAADRGHEQVVELLLEKGADIESKKSGGDTALFGAVRYRNESMVRLLLEKGPSSSRPSRQCRRCRSAFESRRYRCNVCTTIWRSGYHPSSLSSL